MERAVTIERTAGTPAQLRLYLSGGVWMRVVEIQGGRWVFLTRYCPLPDIPNEDEWRVSSGAIVLSGNGLTIRVEVEGTPIGRISSQVLAMHVEAMRRHAERMDTAT